MNSYEWTEPIFRTGGAKMRAGGVDGAKYSRGDEMPCPDLNVKVMSRSEDKWQLYQQPIRAAVSFSQSRCTTNCAI